MSGSPTFEFALAQMHPLLIWPAAPGAQRNHHTDHNGDESLSHRLTRVTVLCPRLRSKSPSISVGASGFFAANAALGRSCQIAVPAREAKTTTLDDNSISYRFREGRRYRWKASRASTNTATEASRQIKPETRAVIVVGRCGPPVCQKRKPERSATAPASTHH